MRRRVCTDVNAMHSPATASSVPNPLRVLGLARLVAGLWFVATGVTTVRRNDYLMPQAQKLFGPDAGTTGAPLRSLLTLMLSAALVVIGLLLVVKGIPWMRRIRLAPGGPASIDREEVTAALGRRQLLSYGDGGIKAPWPLRSWLAEELADMTRWRRDLMNRGVRAFVRSCGFVVLIVVFCVVVPQVTGTDLLGPFPINFVVVLPFVTAIWAVLALLLIGSNGPRIEMVELPLPVGGTNTRPEQIIESAPVLLPRESPGLGLTLGVTGVLVQCLLLSWWQLSPLDYPLLATSIIRHAGSIAGGIFFFVLGGRMVTTAAELLMVFRYESTVALIGADSQGPTVRGAAMRTVRLGLTGPRHIVAAVGGPYVRETVERLIRE
ncbi:MAG: hypothetical protein ACREL5_08030 [Gemmatimonadales bacterium]